MSSADANTPQPTGGNLLRIVAGLHAGASRELAEREMILVGSGDDCDIVLADSGVAGHHALISLVDGRFQVRALDAPLRLEGRVLHPGDPVELDRIQRVGLGEAALAFGHADDPAWLTLAPEGMEFEPPQRRNGVPFARRLPMIAAIAVLSLASLAIFAAVMPSGEPPVDVDARLTALAREFRIADAKVSRDVDGVPVLSGTVKDAGTRQRIRQQLDSERIDATLTLRTGEDLAVDVAEILRTRFPAKTRYLGNNDVEATGYFQDEAAFEAFVKSPAMQATGVRRVVPINLAEPMPGSEPDAGPVDEVRIVSIHRGENAHVVAADGTRYPVGAELPGRGTLVSIGEHAHVLRPDGSLQRLRPEPVLEPPPREGAEGTAKADDEKPGPTGPITHAYATEQARAAAQRK